MQTLYVPPIESLLGLSIFKVPLEYVLVVQFLTANIY